jgi:RNA polymerase sigma-70 factor (ECF subfamily)
VWDAEDLLQDTLLRGFGTIGRGDLHGSESPVSNPKAYLARTAANLWIDTKRRRIREVQETVEVGTPTVGAAITRSAGAALFDRAAPQERVAVVLKDVFDFSLAEIAELLATTEGAVKAALHRGREKLAEDKTGMSPHGNPVSVELADRFVAAFNARDIAAVTALLLESTSFEVQGVGGGRGRRGIWVAKSIEHAAPVERRQFDGEAIVIHLSLTGEQTRLAGITRLEESGGQIARVIDYYFCPETLAFVAASFGLEAETRGYHQDSGTLAGMIASTALPWH